MTAFGASRPLALVSAKVSSPNRQRSLGPGRGSRAISSTRFCRVHDLFPGKPPEGKLDGGEGDEGGQGFG
jgi:hypothetical protein